MQEDKRITMDEFKCITSEIDLVQMGKNIANFLAISDMVKEHNKIQAGITKAKYDALVKEGFTPQQALELCKGV